EVPTWHRLSSYRG
nr:Chain E, Antitoxin HigA1 [Mycobacterium tuberculosis H37Rv]5MTW_F Chain F, Antitoxin HigA1 [Mycobacterium tuberculosis H37Rv]5MTW_G Chain G, Antitoxin HigA1 [Mycobacterium tuberculosis H37Rv]